MSDYNLDREIEEGLARSETMLRRQRNTKIIVALGSFVILICVVAVGGIAYMLGTRSVPAVPATAELLSVTEIPATRIAIASTSTAEYLPSATFTMLPPEKTPFLTATVTSTFSSVNALDATPTSAPLTMQITRSGNEFTFHLRNVPNECNQVTCEFRWTIWEGSWVGGYGNYANAQGEKFTKFKYDSGWKKVDNKELILVYSLTAVSGDDWMPYLVNFRICTDLSRNNCKTVSDQFSQWWFP